MGKTLTIQGKEFTARPEVTLGGLETLGALEEAHGLKFGAALSNADIIKLLKADAFEVFMSVVLDGPVGEVDWREVGVNTLAEALLGFFGSGSAKNPSPPHS